MESTDGAAPDCRDPNELTVEFSDEHSSEQPPGNRRSLGALAGLRIVSLCTFGSRVLGMLRDMMMAASFGSGTVLDAFTVAFRIPNLARRLFGEGALTTAFLPVFVREREQHGIEAAWRLGSSVFTRLATFLTILVVGGELLLWASVVAIDLSAESLFLVQLTALMLPYLLLICLAAQLSAILHGVEHFTWPALLPIVLNIVWIASLLFVVPRYSGSEQQMRVVSLTVLVAGAAQLVLTWPELRRRGFRFQPADERARERVREVVAAMIPVVVGLSITQLNTLMDSVFAWIFAYPASAGPQAPPDARWIQLSEGTASALYFGQRMYQFPLGVFGIALGTVLFPRFSRHASRQDLGGLREDLELGLRLVAAIGIPASAGLVFLAEPVTDLLFRHGEFSIEDARQTSEMIAAYGFGVWAFCGILILNRVFYALGDRRTPMWIGLIAMLVNLPLNLGLAWAIGGRGLAWATTVSGILQLGITLQLTRSAVGRFPWRTLVAHTVQVLKATSLMVAAGVVMLMLFPEAPEPTLVRLSRVLVPLVVASLVYFGGCRVFRIHELQLLWRR